MQGATRCTVFRVLTLWDDLRISSQPFIGEYEELILWLCQTPNLKQCPDGQQEAKYDQGDTDNGANHGQADDHADDY